MIKNYLIEIFENPDWNELKKSYNEFCKDQIKTYVNFKVIDVQYFMELRQGAIKNNERFIILVLLYSI